MKATLRETRETGHLGKARRINKAGSRWLAVLLAAVMVLTMLPASALANVRGLSENSNAINAVLLDELNALYGQDAAVVYTELARLGFLDEDGKLKTDYTIDLDGESLAVDQAMALLDDPATDLSRVAQVDGMPIALSDLKTILQIESELARIQDKYFTGKSFSQEELDALNGVMDQIGTEGITANFQLAETDGFSPLAASLPLSDAPSDLPLLAVSTGPLDITYPDSNTFPSPGTLLDLSILDTSSLPTGKTYSFRWKAANGLPDHLRMFVDITFQGTGSAQPYLPGTTVTFSSGDTIGTGVIWNGQDIDDDNYEGIRNAFTGSILSTIELYDAEGFLFNNGSSASDSWTRPITVSKHNAFGLRTWNTNPVQFQDGVMSYDPQKGYMQWRLGFSPLNPGTVAANDLACLLDTAQAIYPANATGGMLYIKSNLNGYTLKLDTSDYRILAGKLPRVAKADGSALSAYPSAAMQINGRPLAYYDNTTSGKVAFVPFNSMGSIEYIAPFPWIDVFSLPDDFQRSDGFSWRMDYPDFYSSTAHLTGGYPQDPIALDANDYLVNKDNTISLVNPATSQSLFGLEPYHPKVESITVPAGTYASGQYVPIAIAFNQPVDATNMIVTINASPVTAAELGISGVTARRIVAMYKVKDVDGERLLISNVEDYKNLFGAADSDNNGGSGWQFDDVHLESTLMRESVTGLSLMPDSILATASASQREVTVSLGLKQDEAYKTKYSSYNTGTGHAPFLAQITNTASGDSETFWLEMKEDESSSQLWAEGTLVNGESTVDDDGIMNLMAGVGDAGYEVRILAYEKSTDTEGRRVLLPLKSFTVQGAAFVNGLSIVYPPGDKDTLLLSETFRPQLGVQFTGSPTYQSGSWASSDAAVATISASGQVSLAGSVGSVYFTFTADNGGMTDPDSSHVVSASSHAYTVGAGGSPALVIPDDANQIITYKGEKAQVRWSANASFFNPSADFSYSVQLFAGNLSAAQAAGGTPIATYTVPKYSDAATQRPSTTMVIPAGVLNTLSVGGTPAYTVRVSMPHPLVPAETLAACGYIIVRPLLLVPKVSLPGSGQYLLDSQQVVIDWSVANYESRVTDAVLVIKRISTANGQDSTTELWRETVGAASGSYTLVPEQVAGLKDTYMVSLEAKNAGDDGSQSDGYPLYVYNSGALSLQMGGQGAPDALTMDNTSKVDGALPTDTFNIMQMRQELALLEYIGINYGDYDWSQLKDGIKWDTSNHDAATLSYKQGGLYEDLSLFSMNSYLPQTQMALSGLKNGQATITATHANTGMSDAVDVGVRTLRDRFYLFQLTPMVKTALTYTDGNGQQKTVETNDQGSLALYEPLGIASEVQMKSTDSSGNVYLGSIAIPKLLSGERDATKLQLYPLNTFKLRQVAKVEAFLKRPDGSPYTGTVTLRGGAYKNGGYCQDARLLGNSVPDPNGNPLLDGKQPQTVTIGADGKLTVYMDSLQFWSGDNGETVGTALKPKDDIQYIFEVSDISGHRPLLVYDNGNLALGDVMRSGGNLITLEAYSGAPGAFVSNQTMDYGLSGGRLIDVRNSTGHIGPNSSYTNTTLVTTALGWGHAPDRQGYRLVITDEYGYVPAAQTSTAIIYPFSSMPVTVNTLTLNRGTITNSGWVADGKDVGLRSRLELDGAMLSERPAKPRVTDLTNAQKLTESDDVKAVVVDLQNGSAFPGAGAVKIGNQVMNGLLKVLSLYTGTMSGVTTKMVITPSEDSSEFNAFIWAGYNSMGLDDMDYDSNGMILDTSLLESSLSLGPSLKDATEMGMGKYDANKSIKDAKANQAEGKGSKDVDVTGQLEGFFDAKIKYDFNTKKWSVFVTDGGFTIGAGVNFKYVINAEALPLTAEFQAGGALQLDFKANLLREQQAGLPWKSTITANYVNDYLITLRINLFLYAFGGLGVDYSAVAVKIGPFGKLTVDFAAKFLSRNYLADSDKRLDVGLGLRATGEVGVKFVMQVLFIQYELVIGSVTAGYQAGWLDWYDIDSYWSETWSSMFSTLAASAPVTGFAPVSGSTTLQGRDYLSGFVRNWAANSQQQITPLALDSPNALAPLQTNAYPFSFPLVTGDGQHLLYAFDNNSVNIADTRVFATQLAGNAYPQGSEIAAPGGFTGFGDSGLSLAGSSGFAASAWVRQGVELPPKNAGDPLSPAEQGLIMNGTEVVAAIYDGTAWASTRLTDNALPDIAPVVATDGSGRAFVAWRSVYSADDSNLLDFSQQDYIIYSIYDSGAWSTPKRLYSGTSGTVRGITAAMLPDGTAAVAYALDTASAGNTADYEVGYAIVDQTGNPSAGIVVSRDQWLNQNPQLTVAQFGTDAKFVLGWHSMRDGFSDIRLACFDAGGMLSNTFPDSVKETASGVDVVIDGNFRFAKAGAALSDISNLSIIWPEVATDADGDPDHGILRAMKFNQGQGQGQGQGGIGISAALDVADLPYHAFVNHFDAYVPGPGGNTVKAVIQGTVYHDIDPNDPNTYDSYTVPDIDNENGGSNEVMVPKEEVRLYTATESYANKAQVSSIAVDFATIGLDSLVPVQFSLLNMGMDDIDSATVRLGGQDTTFIGLGLRPNEEAILTCWYPVGNVVENLPYELSASFGTAGLAQSVLTGTVYLDYPDLGISQMSTISEELGKRTVCLSLYNSAAATLAGGKGRTVKLGLYGDPTFETPLDATSATAGVTVSPDKTLSISDEVALGFVDNGSLVLDLEFDLAQYLSNAAEVPESGVPFYAKVWATEDSSSGANGANVMPEYYRSDNVAHVTFESPLARTGQLVSIAVEQGLSGSSNTVANITLHNNSLSSRASGNLIVSLLDDNGNVLEQKQAYASGSGMVGLNGEETKSIGFMFSQSGSRVTAIYGDLVLADANANLAALSFDGLAVRLSDFVSDVSGGYRFTAPNTVLGSTLVSFVTENPGATVKINGSPATTGQNISIPDGQSTITVEVTSANRQAVQIYVLTVNRPAASYVLTVVGGSGSGSYASGDQVGIAAHVAPSGKVFDRWTGGDGGTFADAAAASTTFTMPANAATVTATYKDSVAPNVYGVTDHFGAWTGSGTVSARIDADHTKFVSLAYNGADIDPQHYTVTQGSTIITLTESCLSSYPDGVYVFVAHFSDGHSDNIILTVNRAAGGGGSGGPGGGGSGGPGGGGSGVPSTGDAVGLALLATAMAALAVGVLNLLYRKRRKERLDAGTGTPAPSRAAAPGARATGAAGAARATGAAGAAPGVGAARAAAPKHALSSRRHQRKRH